MALNARDLPEARMRRRAVHALLALALVLSTWWTWSRHAEVARLEGQKRDALARIPVQEDAADRVAGECGLEPFSDEESLRSFPMKISRFPTPRERACGEKVTRTRSDLIETYLELERLRPVLATAGESAAPTVPVTATLAAGAALWLWLSEIRHRRRPGS